MDIGETLGAQQIVDYVLRGDTNAHALWQPH
jgi:hypothetical protein